MSRDLRAATSRGPRLHAWQDDRGAPVGADQTPGRFPGSGYRQLQGDPGRPVLSPALTGTDSQNSWQSFSCLTNTESANEASDKHER